jgi:hypothetical protein
MASHHYHSYSHTKHIQNASCLHKCPYALPKEFSNRYKEWSGHALNSKVQPCLRITLPLYSEFLNARESYHPATLEMYTSSNQLFIQQLKRSVGFYTQVSPYLDTQLQKNTRPQRLHPKYNKLLGRYPPALMLHPPHHPHIIRSPNWEDKDTKVGMLQKTRNMFLVVISP